MSTTSRFAPLGSLLAARLKPLDTEPWLGRHSADPRRAWSGRARLDRSRVELRPEDADAWWRLGVAMNVLDRHRDASAAFSRALRRDTCGSGPAQVLVLDDGMVSSVRRREILGEVGDWVGAELLWICTRPVDFDAALVHAEALEGRIYRIETPLLEPFLAHFPMPRVRFVLARTKTMVRALPPRVRRVRIPGAMVEPRTADLESFDTLLCPSRLSALAWTGLEITPVAWPHVEVTRAAADDVVIEMTCGTDHVAAWDDATVIDLIERLTLELPDITVSVRPAPSRRGQALRLWKQWKHGAADGGRVRIDLQRSSIAGRILVTEAAPEAWAAHLHGPNGLIVLDPGGREVADGVPTTVDSALRVVEALHAHRAGGSELDTARERARDRILFRESDPEIPRLSAWVETVLRQVPSAPQARRAGAGEV